MTMTEAARPAGRTLTSTLTEAARAVSLEVFEQGLTWLDEQVTASDRRSRTLSPRTGDARPMVADRTPVRRRPDDLIAVMNKLILSVVVLWVPAACAWWISSTLAALPILFWYVLVAPVLMRDIWRSRRPADAAEMPNTQVIRDR
jgi:hypothetical protein